MEENSQVNNKSENIENNINNKEKITNIDIKDQIDTRINYNNESLENAPKLNKLSYPKRKFAIIHGYNGHAFSGNQK